MFNLRFAGVQYNKHIQKSQLWSKPYFKRVEYDGMGEFFVSFYNQEPGHPFQ